MLYYFLIFLSVLMVESIGETYGQVQPDSLKPFTLTLTTFNHAARFYAGTSEYTMTDTHLKVINYGLFESKKTVFSKRLSKNAKALIQISNTRLDSLKDSYINSCVMLTSGTEYFLTFKKRDFNKNYNNTPLLS